MHARTLSPPRGADMAGPLALIYGYAPQSHPGGPAMGRRAMALVERLRRVASLQIDPHWDGDLDEQDTRNGWIVSLEAARELHRTLEGRTFHLFVQDVRRVNPQLASLLDGAAEAARERLVDFRAFVATLVDEADADELGVEVLPDVSDAGPGPSTEYVAPADP